MPRSGYFVAAVEGLLEAYAVAFPDTLYPASLSCDLLTHITPGEERLKKVVFVFPSMARSGRTYSGVPAVIATVHQDRGDRERLALTVTDVITGRQVARKLRASLTSQDFNRRAMDAVVREIKRAMWRVGGARPDHYLE